MSVELAFVDSIAAAPNVRLNLNVGPWSVHKNTRFYRPKLKRAIAGESPLGDGETYPADKYQNRLLQLVLQLNVADQNQLAVEQQKLHRELDRPTNILKYRPHTDQPVFFRTFRADIDDDEWPTDGTYAQLTIPVLAQPFAYGPPETPVNLATLNTDPEAGSNGCLFDIAGSAVKGDVDTPAIIRWPQTLGVEVLRTAVFATRRGGTPANALFKLQAEAMTQGTDTTVQANDALMSGAGSNYSRCTFATVATMATRLSVTDIGVAGADLRGTFHLFLRFRKSVAGDTIQVRLIWGTGDGQNQTTNATVTLPNSTKITLVDLGRIQVPYGFDRRFGRDEVEISVSDAYTLTVQAARTAGTGNLDMDVMFFPPDDDRYARVTWNATILGAVDRYYLDADDNNVEARDSSDRLISAKPPTVRGGLPMLSPNQPNRIYVIYETTVDETYTLQAISNVSVIYQPRYLDVRPPTT